MNTKQVFNFEIKVDGLDNQIEKFICNKLNLKPPESYDRMTPDELDSVYKDVVDNFDPIALEGFVPDIILSIRANLMRSHMMISHKSIQEKKISIINDYENGMGIKELTKKYDGSPLNLLRLIFQSKYDVKLTAIIKKKIKIDPGDEEQLQWAMSHDTYALINQSQILARSNQFENKIEEILSKHNIQYKTQSQLAQEQINLTGKAYNTPDFLILDDLYINKNKIGWIDAKNFYGANISFMKKNIRSQTNKYINEWGHGSVIYNLGFNSNLSFDNILLLDYKSFKDI